MVTYRSSYSRPFRKKRDNIGGWMERLKLNRDFIPRKTGSGITARSAEVPQRGRIIHCHRWVVFAFTRGKPEPGSAMSIFLRICFCSDDRTIKCRDLVLRLA